MNSAEKLLDLRNTSIQDLYKISDRIEEASNLIKKCFKHGYKVLLCGNGGSAADAQHIAAEFVSKLDKPRQALPAIALTVDTSALTAIANDWEYEYVFTRQLEALASPHDVLICISTSGESKNVINAMRYASVNGILTIALTKNSDCSMARYASVLIPVGSDSTAIAQEKMLVVEHIICQLVEDSLMKEGFLKVK